MAHGDRHHHHHHHHHSCHQHAGGSESIGRLRLAFLLNFSFAILELIGGFYTNSVAVLSDALHDFGDALAFAIAIGLEKFSHRGSDKNYSYGYRRFSTLAALLTGVILVIGSLLILTEAIPRLLNPVQPQTNGMLLLAVVGLSVNGYAAWKVSKGQSLNEKMIMWHLVEDVLGWVLVLVGAVIMKFWNIPQIDAAMGCLLSFWVLFNVFKNLKETLTVFLQGTPHRVQISDLEDQIRQMMSVEGVHHSHLWSLDGEKHIFTTHLVLHKDVSRQQIDEIKLKVKTLTKKYDILEATIEIEFSDSNCIDPEHI